MSRRILSKAPGLIESVKKLLSGRSVRTAATYAEGWWFDVTRNVKTSGGVFLNELTLTGDGRTGFPYLPTRPSVARQVLEHLPIDNFEEYTFVDLGSGKGRMLLVAAGYPFRKIEGVEFAVELHHQAQRNISRYRSAKRRSAKRCGANIESINIDATEYRFPDGNLVLYLFNPFGPEVLEKVFANLAASLAQHRRRVIVAMMNPEHAHVLDAMPYLEPCFENRRFKIYQTRETFQTGDAAKT